MALAFTARTGGLCGEVAVLNNDQWPDVIQKLLRGSPDERRAARETLWKEVTRFVVQCAALPIGPLADDEEARRDIAVRVLKQLEDRDFRHVREWDRRRQGGRDTASWWTFVGVLVKHRAIDHARGSRLNTAPRHEGFQFAKVVPTEPRELADHESS
ncbi:MAG TPA: hypothetical protein VFP84_12460, partial [Kofleriaceae bacterium]|nr:hypothetical protein [Kofleriaceae bacterium]